MDFHRTRHKESGALTRHSSSKSNNLNVITVLNLGMQLENNARRKTVSGGTVTFRPYIHGGHLNVKVQESPRCRRRSLVQSRAGIWEGLQRLPGDRPSTSIGRSFWTRWRHDGEEIRDTEVQSNGERYSEENGGEYSHNPVVILHLPQITVHRISVIFCV